MNFGDTRGSVVGRDQDSVQGRNLAAPKRILIVEDEQDIADLLAMHLADLGAITQHEANGLRALEVAQRQPWDLVLLDIRLPGLDGLEVCRRLRSSGNGVPIVLLTAKTTELDRVLGLEVGADDYVSKPFSVMEVVARVRAIFRRVEIDQNGVQESLDLCHQGLNINASRREVSVRGRAVELTPREFDLLAFFAANPGTVFKRAQLLDKVWGYGHEGYEHTVNSHINRLRNKIQPGADDAQYIVTVWGVGYKFNDAPDFGAGSEVDNVS